MIRERTGLQKKIGRAAGNVSLEPPWRVLHGMKQDQSGLDLARTDQVAVLVVCTKWCLWVN